MNTKSFIALIFLALASSVNAAPTRQFLFLGLVIALTPELASNKVIKTLETLVGQVREEPIVSPNLSRGLFDDLEDLLDLGDDSDLADAF